MNDVFKAVWQPLTSTNDVKVRTRRLLERTYIKQLDAFLNQVEKDKSVELDRARPSDISLYLGQQLDTIEQYCKAQAAISTDLNLLHYNDILRQIKLIRERQNSVK